MKGGGVLLSGWQKYERPDETDRWWRVWLRPTISGGRYVYSEVRVESLEDPPEQVTLAALRTIGLPSLMRQDEDERRETLERLKPRGAANAELHAVRAGRQGGYRDEHWQAVLRVHRRAERAGEAPTKAVQRYLEDVKGEDVPYGTAARHVQRAKEWGRKQKGGRR